MKILDLARHESIVYALGSITVSTRSIFYLASLLISQVLDWTRYRHTERVSCTHSCAAPKTAMSNWANK